MDIRHTRRALVARFASLVGAAALPTGAVAAAIPADLSKPTTEVVPKWVMPFEARLFVVGFVGDDPADDFHIKADVTISEDGTFEVGFFCGRLDTPVVQVGGYAGTGQESAGAVLSALFNGMQVAGKRSDGW